MSEFLEQYENALADPELKETRRGLCSTLAAQMAECGDRLWAFGMGPADARTAISFVVQFGGSLAEGAVMLGSLRNWYAASALVRQLIEVEYLVYLFCNDLDETLRWLRGSTDDLRTLFSPSKMRQRAGEGQFRPSEYQVHCSFGGHPTPRAQFLLPSRILKHHQNPIGSNEEVFWVDLAQHLRRLWRHIEALSIEHPSAHLDVIHQYAGTAALAIERWEAADPRSLMLSDSFLAELAAGKPNN
jgi:hypothetical protein